MRIEAAKSETKSGVVYLQGSFLDVKLSNHEQGSRLKYASSYILFFLMCTHGAVASGCFKDFCCGIILLYTGNMCFVIVLIKGWIAES